MKHFIKLLLLPVIASCLTIGCKDNMETQPVTHSEHGINHDEEDDFYKNASNPYDYIGQTHNDMMEYGRLQMLSWDTTVNNLNDSLRAIAFSYATTNLGMTSTNANIVFNTVDSVNNLNGDTNLVLQMISTSGASIKAKDYLTSLMRASYYYSDETELTEKVTQIKKIEADVIADQSLTIHDRETILGGASVARHSAYYWNTHSSTWPGGICPIFNWIAGGSGSFLDWMAFTYLHNGGYPLPDSIAGAALISYTSYCWFAYNF